MKKYLSFILLIIVIAFSSCSSDNSEFVEDLSSSDTDFVSDSTDSHIIPSTAELERIFLFDSRLNNMLWYYPDRYEDLIGKSITFDVAYLEDNKNCFYAFIKNDEWHLVGYSLLNGEFEKSVTVKSDVILSKDSEYKNIVYYNTPFTIEIPEPSEPEYDYSNLPVDEIKSAVREHITELLTGQYSQTELGLSGNAEVIAGAIGYGYNISDVINDKERFINRAIIITNEDEYYTYNYEIVVSSDNVEIVTSKYPYLMFTDEMLSADAINLRIERFQKTALTSFEINQ